MLQLRRRFHYFSERAALISGDMRADCKDPSIWSRRLIFVCSGNICRSPYAEVVARDYGMKAISCGTDTQDNLPANDAAIKEAARRGRHLEKHTTTRWESVQLDKNDILVATELHHARTILPRAREVGCEVILLSSLLLPKFDVIWDPYGRSAAAFVRAFDLIDEAVATLSRLQTSKNLLDS